MYYLIGIKGAGMSSLACILKDLGYEVAGSDYEDHYFTQEPLEALGIPIYPFNKDNIKEDMEVIIGNAFDETNEEVRAVLSNDKIKHYSYHEFLGHLMSQYIGISIAGTHGKTTTTGLAYQALKDSQKASCLIGDGTGHIAPDSKYFILESCEYRHHFLAYHPDYAIITNIELDHVDYYKHMDDYIKAYEMFADQVKKKVIVCHDDPYLPHLKTKTPIVSYGVSEGSDYHARNVNEGVNGIDFDLYIHNQFAKHISLPFFGHHMLLNALSIVALCDCIGQSVADTEMYLQGFEGVKRRFTISTLKNDVYIDDYAHHPTAVRVTIDAARKKYPNKKIIAIYKPHRYSRMYHFVEEFKEALMLADEVYLCHFPIHQPKDEGVDIDIYYLADRIPGAVVLSEDENGAKELAKYDDVVYLFMSSKDIYHLAEQVKKIKQSVE